MSQPRLQAGSGLFADQVSQSLCHYAGLGLLEIKFVNDHDTGFSGLRG